MSDVPISIAPIEGAFAGRVSGIDLAWPLTPDEVAVLEAGMDRHAVLAFHDQPRQVGQPPRRLS